MKILVIGGTGFISRQIVKNLLDKGHHVSVLNRGLTPFGFEENNKPEVIIGDRNNEILLKKLASDNHFDVVYDMIAYKESETITAAEVFKNKTGRFIHCSTISVYMMSEQISLPITEDQINLPQMKPFYRSPFGWDYGKDKLKCEEALWNRHDPNKFPVTILRPTFVSGPGDPAKRDFFWIERILDGNPLLVPGHGDFRFQQVYINDVANAFCDVAEYNTTVGEAYNVAGEEVFTLNSYLNKLMELLNVQTQIFHIDQKSFDDLSISYSDEGDVFPFNTRRDAVFSLKKIKEHTGYSPVPFDDYMKITIDWFLSKFKKHSIGYNKRKEELRIINTFQLQH